jgi:hypothetical protein
VYIPDALIVPVEALPPVTPFTCQVTEVFDDPVTVALNGFVAPARTLALEGEIATVTPGPEGGALELEDELFVAPVQPASTPAASRNTNNTECLKDESLDFSIFGRTGGAAPAQRIS